MSRPTYLSFYLCGLAGLCVIASPATPQSAAPARGQSYSFASLSSTLEASDNYNLSTNSAGNALLWTNTLSTGLVSVTPVDNLDASVSGDIRAAELPTDADEFSIDNGTINLNFNRIVDDNSLYFRLFFNDADIEFVDPLRTVDDQGNFDDTLGQGRRRLTNLNAGASLAANGPFSFDIDGSMRLRDYRDITDSSLEDGERYSVSSNLGFEISPVLRAVLYGQYSEYDQTDIVGGSSKQTTSTAQLGFDGTISQRLSTEVRLGYGQAKSVQDGVTDKDQDGISGRLRFLLDMPNGTADAQFNARQTENGQRNDLQFSRSIALRSGSLSGSLGVTNSDLTDIRPIAGLNYVYNLPTTRVSVGFRQTATVDDDGNDVINVNLSAALNHSITPLSSVGVSILAARREELTDFTSDGDLSRLTVSAQYSHLLTKDWQLTGGISHRQRLEDDSDDALENSLFLTLGRSWYSLR
ncbi:MAG: hypothetical protein ACPGNV_16220 [Mangrovicoccus sp.]